MRKNNDVYTDEPQEQKSPEDRDPEIKREPFAPLEAEEELPAAGDEATEQELLQRKIADLEQEKEELMGRLMRLQADFDNYRKRSRAEREEIVDYAAFDLICKLLPVIDNLDRACTSTETGSEGIVEGVAMITRQLKELLEKQGVKVIECKGKPFNPQYHEAVLREESGEYPPDTIVDELQKGYILKDRVIRPSMVKVSVK
ncbi:MAG: nucleotide exchange factor GrpE [Bacillota bacterium]